MALAAHIDLRSELTALGAAAEDRFVVAVSGGADSMVLAHLCLQLLKKTQWCVAHLDHGVRGDTSRQDALWVDQYWTKRGIRTFTENLTWPSLHRTESEASLRQARYTFLERVRQEFSAQWVLTAHHAADQLETVLFRWLRGAGIRGLAGIPARNHNILRPLLNYPKAALDAYRSEQAIPCRIDITNEDPRFFRNRIRHELLPILTELAAPYGGKSALEIRTAQWAQDLAGAESELEIEAVATLARLATPTIFWVRVPWQGFESCSRRLRLAMLQHLWREQAWESLSRDGWNLLLNEISRSRPRLTPCRGATLEISAGFLYVHKTSCPRQLTWQSSPETHADLAGTGECPEMGVSLEWSRTHGLAAVELRFAQPGDRFRSESLGRALQKHRVPVPERPLIPVLAAPHSKQVEWFLGRPSNGLVHVRSDFPFAHFSRA